MQTDQLPIFRVFLSSTFSDFHPERNYLERHVFPQIRQFCEARGARFQHVDLRWGISETAAREMKAAELCELELERCQHLSPRPNFVILAGDRYGWCPPPRRISEADWGPLLQALPHESAQFLIAAYQRDKFAVPPEYLLRPDRDLIPKVQAILRSASQQAFPKDAARRLRYEGSITHQEIWSGALSSQTPVDHVFLFHRQFHALPPITLEFDHKNYGDYFADGSLDQAKFARQRELCQQLQSMLPDTSKYSVTSSLDEWLRDAKLVELGQRLEHHLCRVIEEELTARRVGQAHQEPGSPTALVNDLIDSAIPRDELIDEIYRTAHRETGLPTFVRGASGTGKSTLLAMLLRRLQAANEEIIWFSPGMTGSGSDLTTFLNQICASLATRQKVASQPTENSSTAAQEFARLLRVPVERRIYLILDGLDQLETSDRAHELWWLPTTTGPQISIIASIAVEPGTSTVISDGLANRFHSSNQNEVGELGPGRALQAVDHHLARHGRLIAGQHREVVCSALAGNSTALFARLIGQVAATWHSFGTVVPLPQDSVALFQEICTKWSTDNEHGTHLVRTVLGAISVSRTGLTEDEVLDLVSRSAAVQNEVRIRFPKAPDRERLPFAVWARLSSDLRPFLAEQTADRRLVLFHGKLRTAAIDWAAPDPNTRRELHAALARYFQERGLKSAKTASRTDPLTRRFLTEAIFHAIQSADSEVINRLTTGPALRDCDKFLGIGRTQNALQEFCRAVSEYDSAALTCLLQCARSFVERQQETVSGKQAIATTSELIYAGDFAAAETLIASQSGTRQRLSYAGAAEILDSLQQFDLARHCREQAGDTNDFFNDLPLFQQELLKSLSQADQPIRNSSLPGPYSQATQPVDHEVHGLAKTCWIAVAFFVMCLHGIAWIFGLLSLLLAPLVWVSGEQQYWGRVGEFLGNFLILLVIARFATTRLFRRSATLASQEFARLFHATKPVAPREASLLCYMLDWLEFKPPLMTAVPIGSLIRYAVQEAEPTTAARLLIHCSVALPASDLQIGQHLRSVSAGRQQQLVAELHHFVSTRTVGFPLYSALAKSIRGVETAPLLAIIADDLCDAAMQAERTKNRWFSRWRRHRAPSQEIAIDALIQELPRPVRAEILLLPDRTISSSVRLLWRPLIYWPQACFYTFTRTHLLEKLFLGTALLCCVVTFAMVTSYGQNPSSLLLFVTYAGIVLAALSYGIWCLDGLGSILGARPGSRSIQVNHFIRNKQPPWKWSNWLPWIGGYFYLALIFGRSSNLASGRSGYGSNFESDLMRYSLDWAPIVQRYRQQRNQRSHSIPPPPYAFLGPAGIADLLLLRLIIRRGWTEAINGPAFPEATWQRVTRLLIQSDWLGPSPKLLTETLRLPIAATVVIKRLRQGISSEEEHQFTRAPEELDRRIDEHWARTNDLMPAILHRAIVVGIALIVAVLAVHPFSMSVCQSILGGVPFPESGLMYWYSVNVAIAAWYLPTCKSRLARAGSCAIGVFTFLALHLYWIGLRDYPPPFSTSIERAGLLAVCNVAPIPLLFFAPWILATYRGSLLLLPSPAQRTAVRCLSILLVPLLSVILLLYLQVGATIWIGLEKICHTFAD